MSDEERRPPRELVLALEALQALKQITGMEPHIVICMGGDESGVIATSNEIDKLTGMRMIISVMKACNILAEEVDIADRKWKQAELPVTLHEDIDLDDEESEEDE